jgi:pantoate--beta-alanine ligase
VQVIKTVEALQQILQAYANANKKIGFVPTMGALHEGHISLIDKALKENDVVVASIFVNPTQFNNPADLERYPRMPLEDITRLEKNGCHLAFLPEVDTIYPNGYTAPHVDLGTLDKVMEGKHRPGHFQGVVTVVSRLFDIVKPTNAYFGRKDFQQVAIIKAMTTALNLPINIVECPTRRDEKGLALSSRNLLLSKEGKNAAYAIYATLSFGKSLATSHTPAEVAAFMIQHFSSSMMELEYLEIVDPTTLAKLTTKWVDGATACIVAHCDKVRLIDNLELIPYS